MEAQRKASTDSDDDHLEIDLDRAESASPSKPVSISRKRPVIDKCKHFERENILDESLKRLFNELVSIAGR